MKVLMIFDQIQAGMGSKEKSDIPLGGKKGEIGSVPMIKPHLQEVDGEVIACLYCGDKYFKENEDEVSKKMVSMVKKLNPDIVICGPAYNYKGYAYMSARLAKKLNENTDIPALAVMSEENEDIILKYKNSVNIVKMPKKSGIGLKKALNNICILAEKIFNKEDIEELKKNICY
ncbi:glycine/betaine/sarcosine/D-proline family reductase selenoprotein B [Clostridium sp. D2Q-14]|uniref:GrdB-related putative oxidoreductase n=1 Tax=Anaeromonas gelatinilytica TaxID=2683194 RepID=UPI00193BDF24|nr:GrdB-related putative oxidoreductase [Anaeromonas gelatinilytica]MBS4536755.1 glycine/betaine/sarcosine/D-proline family reductase selenoprotein B [Anaeromonas gelatinilytica]